MRSYAAKRIRISALALGLLGGACGRVGFELQDAPGPGAGGMAGVTGGGGAAGMGLGGSPNLGGSGGSATGGSGTTGGAATGGSGSGGTGGLSAGGAGIGGSGGADQAGGSATGGTGGTGGGPAGPALPEVVWGRLFGTYNDDTLNAVAVGPNGGPVVAGQVDADFDIGVATDGYRESLIAAYSADNVYQWHQRTSGNFANGAHDIAPLADGYLVAGEFGERLNTPAGNLIFPGGQNQSYALKLSLGGVIQTAVHLTGDTEVERPCIAGRWLALSTNSNFKANSMTFTAESSFALAQLDSGYGSVAQGKAFGSNPDGEFPELVSGCTAASSGTFYITGRVNRSVNFGVGAIGYSGDRDGFLAAFASNGQALWSTSISGAGFDQGRKVVLAEAQGVLYSLSEFSGTLVRGGAATSAGLLDILIQGRDPATGALAWSLTLGSLSNDGIFAADVDASGNLVFAGYHRFPITVGLTPEAGSLSTIGTFLGSISPTGQLRWVMDLTDLQVNDLAVAPSGAIYAVGRTEDPIVTNSGVLVPQWWDGFLIKLDWP